MSAVSKAKTSTFNSFILTLKSLSAFLISESCSGVAACTAFSRSFGSVEQPKTEAIADAAVPPNGPANACPSVGASVEMMFLIARNSFFNTKVLYF